jgi:hypothetical protein
MGKRLIVFVIVVSGLCVEGFCQKVPTGRAEDFKVKTCLHSVSYAGVWRGQAKLSVDEFLLKAKELGFDGVMLMAKRPHVSPLDYDAAARKALRERIEGLGFYGGSGQGGDTERGDTGVLCW